MSETYADGKPKDCRYCYYFDKGSCTLKGKSGKTLIAADAAKQN